MQPPAPGRGRAAEGGLCDQEKLSLAQLALLSPSREQAVCMQSQFAAKLNERRCASCAEQGNTLLCTAPKQGHAEGHVPGMEIFSPETPRVDVRGHLNTPSV